MKKFKMSPNQITKVHSGKQPFHMSVSHRIENNWESFKNTKSVNSHTIVKDMTICKKEETRKLVKVIAETRFGIQKREVYITEKFDKEKGRVITTQEKKIICFGIIHTLRSDGVYREVSTDTKVPKPSIRKQKPEKMKNEVKTVALKQGGVYKAYRIIRKKK